ncbi:hypothetical protein FC68_GL002010 [Companilactobacillus farciminis KCTC 3681 = DSM 20184]|nr:hypothetical protein FC68_GL002010 [Companilactobacillus farciminis KCTC 3681 = DSM 20184]
MYSRLELRNLDKQRIMELAQELASVPDNDTGYAKHYILEDIENELDAKPIMPQVFDDFAKNFNYDSKSKLVAGKIDKDGDSE